MNPKSYRSNSNFGYYRNRPIEFIPNSFVSVKILLTVYCQERFISRNQARTLIRKRWLAVTKSRGRIWVEEVCPEMILGWLS